MRSRTKHIVIDARIRRTSTGRYTDRLVEHLQNIDDSHRYTVLVQPDDPWQPTAKNFQRADCPYPQFSFKPSDQFKFARQLRKLKPDLVHFTMTQQPLLYFGKIVTTTHDMTMFKFVRRGETSPKVYWFKIRLYKFMMWVAHRKSSRIIVPSKSVATELSIYQPFTARKTIVTYEASEPPLKDKAVKPKRVSGSFLLYVGTAFPHKNLKRMIKAFNILHAQRPGLKLVLTGKTEKHYEELAEWAKNQPSYQNIIFTGFVPDASLKWLYTHAKAYVFTSLSEGFGLPPLEAMTYGAPVAASNYSCIPEICGPAAHYFDAQKPEAIAKGVADVLDDKKLRKELVDNGYLQIKKYSWSHMAHQTLVIYKMVLEY